ncbi:putative nucleotidyltransferase substrate binding domain-containing protein [Sulfurimonas sp.]|uniref:putative nucleotidyltransferase substrate binding domain-containing protein n=1 Tax=Sulfurimonas sp. TaxID=2022749 RepID=UPI0026220D06|nr:putative nucleotidyltransferase substrate binding domain-containing protein [Sulfurimonas sp.]
MSILDQKKLIESIHPFELLSSKELSSLMQKIDIAYYPKDTLLISKNLPSVAFYIIIKGYVSEYIDDTLYTVYGEGDSFDADALIYSTTQSKFVVSEDLICYEIQKDDFLDLIQNKRIQEYFLQDFVTRHQHLKEHSQQSQLTPFLVSKVGDIYLHEAYIVEADVSIIDALKEMKKKKATCIIVADNDEYSIVTDTDLRENVLMGSFNVSDAIVNIASKNIISIEINDFLFNALVLMTHNAIKRLVVKDGDKIVGILEQLDLLSYFANHSYLISVQIDKAESLDDLKEIQNGLKNLVTTLDSNGVKVRYISKLVATLNQKIYAKVFEIYVDESLQDKCALIIMGSEGREEQILKTDQDNALIITDDIDTELFTEPMKKLNSALLEIGFAKCEGNVMVSNAYWRRNMQSFKKEIDNWIASFETGSLQNLSIFLDAKCVAGDCALLDETKKYLFEGFEKRNDVLAHLAKATLFFETPISLFSGFKLEKEHENKLDLKKGGIFAIVHGIRCLALENRIKTTNTIERIKELNNRGVFDKVFATELIESFDTLLSIRLKAMLHANNQKELNYINPKDLDKTSRDLLKDSFKVVNRFKKFISFHFHLEMVA